MNFYFILESGAPVNLKRSEDAALLGTFVLHVCVHVGEYQRSRVPPQVSKAELNGCAFMGIVNL